MFGFRIGTPRSQPRRPERRLNVLNRYSGPSPMPGEAEVKYLDGDFRVVRPRQAGGRMPAPQRAREPAARAGARGARPGAGGAGPRSARPRPPSPGRAQGGAAGIAARAGGAAARDATVETAAPSSLRAGS